MSKRKQDQDGLYKRSDSPYWWATYVKDSGKRARRSTKSRDKKEAELVLARWKLNEAEKAGRVASEHTFDELMLMYLKKVSSRKKAGDRDYSSAKHLTRHFSGVVLETMRPYTVEDYIGTRLDAGAQPGTINRETGLLSAAINWARKTLEWDVPNHVTGRKLEEPEGVPRWISREDADTLIKAARKDYRAAHLPDFIILCLNTALRKGEALNLTWDRVDLRNNLIYLNADDQKNGRCDTVPLNKAAREALLSRFRFRAKHCPGSEWVFCRKNGSQIKDNKRSFRSACKRAGIDGFTRHGLRHTCASWLVQAGVPIIEVSQLLRHRDIQLTMRYAKLAPNNVRDAVSVLDSASRLSHEKDIERALVSS